MSTFQELLGNLLDSIIVSISKISANSEIFADQCVLNGFVPPHPGDVQRAIELADSAKNINADALIATFSESVIQNRPSENIDNDFDNIESNDLESIINIANQSEDPSSENVINTIHETFPNIPTKSISNIIKILISKGEIKQNSNHNSAAEEK